MALFRNGYGKAGGIRDRRTVIILRQPSLLLAGLKEVLEIYRGYRLSCQEMVEIQSMGSFWGIWGSDIVGAIDCGSAGVRNAGYLVRD